MHKDNDTNSTQTRGSERDLGGARHDCGFRKQTSEKAFGGDEICDAEELGPMTLGKAGGVGKPARRPASQAPQSTTRATTQSGVNMVSSPKMMY